jgi:heme exporter protein CcmD
MDWAFASFSEFLAMGKYAIFVWPCIGLTVLAWLWLFVVEKRAYPKLSRAMKKQGLSLEKSA